MRLTIRTDGGARGNPGPAAAGVAISDTTGKRLFSGGFFIGETTNNVAEYAAVLRGLELAEVMGGTELEFLCDSDLVVKQINGQYRVKKAHLRDYHQKIIELVGRFEQFTIRHVYREENTEADALVNRAIDARGDIGDTVGERAEQPAVKSAIMPPGNAVVTVADLRGKIQFDNSKPHRQILSQEKALLCEMICLRAGQQLNIEPNWSWATFTVIRGRGTLDVGTESHSVGAGFWVYIGRVDSITFTADTDEPFVIIATEWRNQQSV